MTLAAFLNPNNPSFNPSTTSATSSVRFKQVNNLWLFKNKNMCEIHPQEEEEEETLTLGSCDTDCETLTSDESETMDVDDVPLILQYLSSLPYFMRKAFKEGANNINGYDDHMLLIVSVHAAMLEFGFVCFDDVVSGTKIDGFGLPTGLASSAFTISLCYSLPTLVGFGGCGAIETVVLKFQSLGKFFNIYGSLARNRSNVHRVCVPQYRFVPPIDLALMNCDLNDERNDKDDHVSSYPDSEVYEFRKIVKDGLALPLLIDICEKTGLTLPPCLMSLPAELKVKILELLSGTDIAKIGCVCSELHNLSSNGDLWKRQFLERFRFMASRDGGLDHYLLFATSETFY